MSLWVRPVIPGLNHARVRRPGTTGLKPLQERSVISMTGSPRETILKNLQIQVADPCENLQIQGTDPFLAFSLLFLTGIWCFSDEGSGVTWSHQSLQHHQGYPVHDTNLKMWGPRECCPRWTTRKLPIWSTLGLNYVDARPNDQLKCFTDSRSYLAETD